MKELHAIILFTLFFAPGWVFAQSEPHDISGSWKFDYRFLVGEDKEDVPYTNMYSRLHLQLHSDISDYVAAEVSGDFRLYGITNVTTPEELSEPNSQYPTDAMLWEAYLEIYDLGTEGLDLRVGKQRIAWGTADKLNPTDNLNPDDFSDIFEFGEHVPSQAIRLTYDIGDELGFEFVWLPSMKPVLLPRDESLEIGGETQQIMMSLQEQMQSMPVELTFSEPNVKIYPPPYDLRHSMQAFKIKGMLYEVDYSLSYFHGFDDTPVPNKIELTPDSEDFSLIHTNIDMTFFEYHALGIDSAGELFGIGYISS